MTNLKEIYKNNSIAFAEIFYKVKLYPWQKTLLKTINNKDKTVSYFMPYHKYGKEIIQKGQIEYMKFMEMDFNVYIKDGMEVYEKGKLVKIIKLDKSID